MKRPLQRDELSARRSRREKKSRASQEARRFLEALRDGAFVAVVEENGVLRVYEKSADPSLLAGIEELLATHTA